MAIALTVPAQLKCHSITDDSSDTIDPYICKSVGIYVPEYWGYSVDLSPTGILDSFNDWFTAGEKFIREKIFH
jgi:hypothetical protein